MPYSMSWVADAGETSAYPLVVIVQPQENVPVEAHAIVVLKSNF
jgi:hypothetical protein